MPDPSTLFRLDGKVAVITGSTRGIGLATAKLMGAAGAKIVVSSRKPDACEAVRDKLAGMGTAPLILTPEAFAAMIKSEIGMYAKVIKAANLRID